MYRSLIVYPGGAECSMSVMMMYQVLARTLLSCDAGVKTTFYLQITGWSSARWWQDEIQWKYIFTSLNIPVIHSSFNWVFISSGTVKPPQSLKCKLIQRSTFPLQCIIQKNGCEGVLPGAADGNFWNVVVAVELCLYDC